MSKYIRTKLGVPQPSDFTDSEGTPLVIDLTTGALYFLRNNIVTAVATGSGTTSPTDLGVGNITASSITVTSSTGLDAQLPAATASTAGVATASQVASIASAVQSTRAVNTANGLQGGGDLSADLTLSPIYGSIANTFCQGNDARLSSPFRVVNGSAVIQGVLAEVLGGGLAVVATDSAGVWQAGYGGMEMHPGSARIVGTSIKIDTLIGTGNRAVLTDADGTLYSGPISTGTGTNLSVTGITTTALTVASSTGDDATLPAATASAAGVMTASQVTLLTSAVQGNPYNISSGGVIRGVLSDASTTNVALASTDSAGVWQSGRGGIELSSTQTRVAGTSVKIDSLAGAGNRAVLTDANGALYSGPLSTGSGANFRGRWVSGTSYAINDMILDGPWLAIATAATTERPAPTETAAKVWVIPVSEPVWTGTDGAKLFGTRYGPALDNNLLCGVRVQTNGLGTINSAYIKMQSGTRIDLAVNLAATGDWQEFRFLPIPIPSNQYFDVVVQADSWITNANYYAANAALKSFVDTYPPSVFNENAYGVDALLQNDYASPSWALIAKSVVT